MYDSPEGKISGSADVFRNIRCNLDNKFIESRDSVKSDSLSVFARVRPMLPQEEAKGYKECVAAIDEQTVRVVVPTNSAKYKSSRQTEKMIEDYMFTVAFGPETGQFVFFQETMLNIMSNFVEGSNSLIFSYGITGSGKTYTLQGNSENPGIIPLSLKLFFAVNEKQVMKNLIVKPHMYSDVIQLSESEIVKELGTRERLLSSYDDECETAPGSFRNINEKSFAATLCNLFSDDFEAEERQTTLCAEDMASAQAATLLKEVIKKCADNQPGVCSIWVTFIEIYNENVYDLLQPISKQRIKLNLGEDTNGNVYIKDCTEVCIFTSEEALKILNIGRKNLSIASTKMNYQSSRSHCIYTIRVVRLPDANNINHVRVNRLSFCDLAGSERVSKTHTSGVRLKEAGAINTSLLVLGRCLEQLRLSQMGRDKRLIPFRESKLTRIFSGFFLGQGKAAMIINASPSDYTFDETVHVLKFSAIAKKILMSDTFLSNASSTIHSICDQWEKYKANISTWNESMESEESFNEIIQEKDEIIQKLLVLAENFAKKEQEMKDMEIRIRQEVCEEYAELREELLQMQKARYEEEIDSLTKAFTKRITNMEKRHEDTIKRYKDQLSETTATDESMLNDQSLEDSKSFEALNDSVSLSLSESENMVLKGNIESLQKEIDELKTLKASEEEKVKTYKTDIDNLTKQIEIKDIEFLASKKKMESIFDAQLQKESRKFIDQIKLLEEEAVVLKAAKSSCEKDINVLEGKLSESLVENGKAEKIIHDQCETISTLENENEVLRKEIENLEKKISELKESMEALEMELEKERTKHKKEILEARNAAVEYTNFQKLHHSDLEKKNEKIASLEQELHNTNKSFDTLQKELKLRETVSMELEKEIDAFKQAVDKLKVELEECESLKFEIDKNASIVREELRLTRENSQQLSSKLKEVESKNAAYELEIQKLLKDKENLNDSSRVIALEKELSSVKSELITFKEANRRISDNLTQLEDSEQKLKIEEEKYKKLEDDCNRLKELNENIILEKVNLEKKLVSAQDRIESMHKSNLENLEKKEKECELLLKKYEQDLQQWKQEKLSVDSEAKELKEKLTAAADSIKSLEKVIQEKSSKILEFESLSKQYQVDNEKLKQDADLQKKELEEKLVSATDKIKSMEQDIHQKASRMFELENQIKAYKEEILNLKNVQEDLESSNLELKSDLDSCEEKLKKVEEKLTSTVKNRDSLWEASQKSSENEKELKAYKQEINKLKQCLQLAEEEKKDLLVTFSEKEKIIADIKEELSSVKALLVNAKNDLDVKDLQLKELKNDLAQSNVQFQEKISQLEANKKSLERKELDFNDMKDKYDELKCNFEAIVSDLQNSLASEKKNLTQLKSEMENKETELESIAKKLRKNELEFNALKEKNEKLCLKITDVESMKKNLEKRVSENENLCQEKLKKSQTSYEAKLLMEKEQHTVEIEETMKLKREVERENEKLKEETIKFKENIKLLEEELESFEHKKQLDKNKKETLSKITANPLNPKVASKENFSRTANKTENKEAGKSPKAAKKIETKESGTKPKTSKAAKKSETKETELSPKISSTRSLRRNKIQDISFSSVESESVESGVSRRNRKRVSDEDFDPVKERATKKMKSSEESSKIPVKRVSKRKLLNNDQAENLSPVQKIANSISTKFKSVAESVTSKIASPRLTRQRKKLFNPDSVSSLKSEKVTRGKK